MATVRSVKMKLELDPGKPWEETTIKVKYDGREKGVYRRPLPDHRFSIDLPTVVTGPLGKTEVRGDDPDEVIDKFKEAIKQYKTMNTEENLVILYSISAQPALNEMYPNKYYHHSPGISIDMWAAVFKETAAIAGDGETRRYSYMIQEHDLNFKGVDNFMVNDRSGKRYMNCLPVTEANIAFFLWLKNNLELLGKKMADLHNPEDMFAAITAGSILPFKGGG